MTPLSPIYWAIGLLLASAAWHAARDATHPRRAASATFWGLLALTFFAGDALPRAVIGAALVVIALVAGFGGVARGAAHDDPARRVAQAQRLGHRLFVPALAIPLATIAVLFALRAVPGADGTPRLEPQHATLLALALACAIALVAALRITGSRTGTSVDASSALLEAIGWAAILPLALATLGGVFSAAGVGDLIAALARGAIPVDIRFACVLAYALGMVVFTMIMGNAFAAFPVMTIGIAMPLLVGLHGAEPASLAAIGMLSGYCGTLLTPMAANYNIVPAALLELDDQYAVIRQQALTGALLLLANIAFLATIPFRAA
ncbi:MAG TPA: DUF979 family protein [Candidatus Saccharimonadia bacterium]|nr:DUF979 family protein [Candidatus Saccharimonadia bacterium]